MTFKIKSDSGIHPHVIPYPISYRSSMGALHAVENIFSVLAGFLVGSWAFSVAARRLWNELRLEIRSAKTQISFGKQLKTYFLVRFPT